MQNLLIVSVLDGQTNLSEPVENLVLAEVVWSSRGGFVFGLGLNFRLQVAIVAVVHNDAEFALLGLVNFTETRYIGVIKNLKDLGLLKSLFALLLVHLTNVNLLDHSHLFIRLALDEVGNTEAASSKSGDLFVSLILF